MRLSLANNGLSRFAVDRHPNRLRIAWEDAVEPERRFKANDTIRYALAGGHKPAFVDRFPPPPPA